jgi:hypothetical protein
MYVRAYYTYIKLGTVVSTRPAMGPPRTVFDRPVGITLLHSSSSAPL